MNEANREEKVPLTYLSTITWSLVTLGLIFATSCLPEERKTPPPLNSKAGAELSAPNSAEMPVDGLPPELQEQASEAQDPALQTGILSEIPQMPRGGPEWLKVKAEVFERKGQRFLRTTQFVKNIKNRSLAQQTAVNRARHELTKWLGTPTLSAVTTTAHHWNAKYSLSAAQVEVALPESWTLPTGPDERKIEPNESH